MIIELYGAPGSGKTTLCKKISKVIGFECPMNFYLDNIVGKIFMHLFWHTFTVKSDLRRKYKQIIDIVRGQYTHLYNQSLDIKMYINYLMFAYYVEGNAHDKDIVMDEGILHYCIALYAEFGVEIEKVEQIYELLRVEERVLYKVSTEKTEILQRLKKRNRHVTAIDELPDEVISALLERYYCGEKIFSKENKVENIEELYKEIRRRGGGGK